MCCHRLPLYGDRSPPGTPVTVRPMPPPSLPDALEAHRATLTTDAQCATLAIVEAALAVRSYAATLPLATHPFADSGTANDVVASTPFKRARTAR